MKPTLKLVTFLTALLGGASTFAADFAVNSIGYRYAPSQSVPGVASKVSKNIFTFTHFSTDKLGTNLFSIDYLKSASNDPANGGAQGATEYFGFYQRNFSLSAMTGNKTGYGFAKDLSLTARVIAGTKNTTFAPAPLALQLGMEADMPISAGMWNIGIAAYKENNYNGIVFPGKVAGGVSFKVAPALTTAWAIPVGGVGTFAGFGSIVGPKGKDGFGADTKTETLLQARFMFDVMGPQSGLTAGVGVEYWNNKFGCNNGTAVPANSCKATTPLLLVDYKL